MCLAVPAKVERIEQSIATVDMMGVKIKVAIELLKDIKIGDYILMHAGCAIQKISVDEARYTLALFEELVEPYKKLND